MPELSRLLLALAVERREVDRAVEEVLSRPEYADLQRGGLRALIADLRRRAAEWLAGVLGQEGTVVVAWLVLAVAVALVLLLALRWARRVSGDPAVAEPTLHGPRRAPDEWIAEAERHRAQGRHRDAVRAAFRGLVAGLARAGTVEEVPGTTVGEYRRQVAANDPATASEFAAAADTFEAAWYGDQQPPAADVDRVLAAARRALLVRVPR